MDTQLSSDETIQPIQWGGSALHLLDQRKLPGMEVYVACKTAEEVADAIRQMVVRGAPAIGVTAAFGMVLGMREFEKAKPAASDTERHRQVERLKELFAATRPTAVNLFWALDRMHAAARYAGGARAERLEVEAKAIYEEDILICKAIGQAGLALIPGRAGILTHCNTGSLATAGYGTALGVVRAAVAAGRAVQVYADETRPFLQGSRLTAWECMKEGIPVTLLCDGAAASLMKRGLIDLAIVGADRVAANGDTANKIGTYTVALCAKAHGIPFYVAAPISTVDLATPDGGAIVIEQRDPREVTHFAGVPVAPEGVRVENPSFDVTPAALISGIITERGVARPPFRESLAALLETKSALSL